ncbi:hypothetical protein ADEAN_000228200 [Angomonas deanei]|uniref:Uncharacterized protein n=1 Tax=Angomonas deanei TaxID=59799 RepID=A0A7G2C716_9TRYP|nr:hypothetical protein ADEAN_000228200 [Angomonas deanei]
MPQANNVLPLSLGCMQHFYTLSQRKGSSTTENSHQTKIAMEILRHVSLENSGKVPRIKKEDLAMQQAKLLLQQQSPSTEEDKAKWTSALRVLQESRDVRLSVKESVFMFTVHRNQWAKAVTCAANGKTTTNSVPLYRAVRCAPSWVEGLRVCETYPTSTAAKLGFIERADVKQTINSSQAGETAVGVSRLVMSYFLSLPEEDKKLNDAIALLHTAVRRVSADDTEFMENSIHVLSGAVQHYLKSVSPTDKIRERNHRSAELCNRLEEMLHRQQWREAVALSCALHDYETAMAAAAHLPSECSVKPIKEFQACVKQLEEGNFPPEKDATLPEVMAHLIYNEEWNVASVSMRYNSVLIQNVVHARLMTGHTGHDHVPQDELFLCFYPHTPSLTKALNSIVPVEGRKAFAKGLSRQLRRPFFLSLTPQERSEYVEGDDTTKTFVVRDLESGSRWAEEVLTRCFEQYRKCTHEMCLKEVARLAAAGRLQLSVQNGYAIGQTLLHYCSHNVRVTTNHRAKTKRTGKDYICFSLDASSVLRTFRSIPSVYLSHDLAAQNTVLQKLVLLDYWEDALKKFHLLEKKGLFEESSGDAPSMAESRPPIHTSEQKKIVETMTKVVYAHSRAGNTKRTESSKKWVSFVRKLWRRSGFLFPLCVLEVLHNDLREMQSQIRRLSNLSANGVARTTVQQESLRQYVGACFSLLDAENQLKHVVGALRKSQVDVEDVDSFGLQRILSVLEPRKAITTLQSLQASPHHHCTAIEEHWLLRIACRVDKDSPDAEELYTQIRLLSPYSVLVNSFCFTLSMTKKGDYRRALSGVLRSIHIINTYPFTKHLYHCLAMLQRALVNDALEWWNSTADAGVVEEERKLTKMIFNRLQLNTELTESLRTVRRALLSTFQEKTTRSSCIVLLAAATMEVCRNEKLPLPAVVVHRLLTVATAEGDDWQAALFVLNNLKRPTVAEKLTFSAFSAKVYAGGVCRPGDPNAEFAAGQTPIPRYTGAGRGVDRRAVRG